MAVDDKLPILKMRNSLSSERTATFRLPKWLRDSYKNPNDFWTRYLELFTGYAGLPSRARYQEGYDFYHDLVTRNLEQAAPAFIHWAGDRGELRLSYAALNQRCRALEAVWEASGVVAGDTIAVVLPMSPAYVVACLTALKMGAVVVSIPMFGRQFAIDYLEQSGATWWVTEDRYTYGIEYPAQRLALQGTAAPAAAANRSYFYAADETALQVFSPVQDLQSAPIEVSAQSLFLGVVRDAALVLSLDAGDVLAAPGFCPLQFQPCLLLSCLSVGATYVEMNETQLEQIGPDLSRFELTHLLVTPRVRESLIRDQFKGVGGLKRWFRNAHGSLEWGRWDLFSAKAKSLNARGMSYFANAAAGGAVLHGVSRLQPQYLHVLPVAGSEYSMADTNLSGMPSVAEHGILEWKQLDSSETVLGQQLLSQDKDEYILIGPIKPHRSGQSYPRDSVVGLTAEIGGIESTSIVYAPAGKSTGGWQAILVVFVPPDSPVLAERSKLEQKLATLCKVELGGRAVPDKIEVFGLVPHSEDEVVSQVWCESQYLTGMLHRKEQVPAFRHLSKLRYAVKSLLQEQEG
ncbi:MAG: acyl-CoA synthetase [Deltaproteobacteria bacterium]|nr:acyl-CoA synthetase [Deltaproteobacteria bacterium]